MVKNDQNWLYVIFGRPLVPNIVAQKFLCISNIFPQNGVKISECNYSSKFMRIYWHYIYLYLFIFSFESPWRTNLRLRVLHFFMKSLRNGGGRGEILCIVMKRDIGEWGLKKALPTYWIVTLIINNNLNLRFEP